LALRESQPTADILECFIQRFRLPCFHLRNTLRDRLPILLLAQGFLRLAMGLAIDDEIDAASGRIDGLDFVLTTRVEGVGQFVSFRLACMTDFAGPSGVVSGRPGAVIT